MRSVPPDSGGGLMKAERCSDSRLARYKEHKIDERTEPCAMP